MNYFYAVIGLTAGLGAFLLGFKVLSDNMEKLFFHKLKKFFSGTARNKLAGVGVGIVSAALVQSSSITTVMVVEFVNVGVLSLYQATAVIMGANIGSTITAHITAAQSFGFIQIAMPLTAVGMFMNMFSKKESVHRFGFVLAGLGLVFMGLDYMEKGADFFKESRAVTELIENTTNPFLLFSTGIVITALIQSSGALTSVIISLANAGIIIGQGGNSVLFLILGANIGTCITALISSVGTNRNAKRACSIHIMFNLFGAIIFAVILLLWKDFMRMTFAKWFSSPAEQIAMFHTFFNTVCTVFFFPFISLFVRLSGIFVRDRAVGQNIGKKRRFCSRLGQKRQKI